MSHSWSLAPTTYHTPPSLPHSVTLHPLPRSDPLTLLEPEAGATVSDDEWIPPAYIDTVDGESDSETDSPPLPVRSPPPAIALPLSHSLTLPSSASLASLFTQPRATPASFLLSLNYFVSQLDCVVNRSSVLYQQHGAALVQEFLTAINDFLDSEEYQSLRREAHTVYNGWKNFFATSQGEQMLVSLYTLLSSHNLSIAQAIQFFTQNNQSQAQPQSAAQPPPPPQSQSQSLSQSSMSKFFSSMPSPFTLTWLLLVTRSLIQSNAVASQIFARVESIIFVERADDSAQLHLLAAYGRSLIAQLKYGTHFVRRWLSIIGARRDTSPSSTLSLLYKPNMVFDELMMSLIRQDRSDRPWSEPVLHWVKRSVIEAIVSALLAVEVPAQRSDDSIDTSFFYHLPPFSLSSVSIDEENLTSHYCCIETVESTQSVLLGKLCLSMCGVGIEANDVGWQCKQLVFPYLQGGGFMHASMVNAGIDIDTEIRLVTDNNNTSVNFADWCANRPTVPANTRVQLRLSRFALTLGDISLRVSGSAMSGIYNALLGLLTPILIRKIEKDVTVLGIEQCGALVQAATEHGQAIVQPFVRVQHQHRLSTPPLLSAAAALPGLLTDSASHDQAIIQLVPLAQFTHSSTTLTNSHTAVTRPVLSIAQSSQQQPQATVRFVPVKPSISRQLPPSHPNAAVQLELSRTSSVPTSSSPFFESSMPPLFAAFPDFASGF